MALYARSEVRGDRANVGPGREVCSKTPGLLAERDVITPPQPYEPHHEAALTSPVTRLPQDDAFPVYDVGPAASGSHLRYLRLDDYGVNFSLTV